MVINPSVVGDMVRRTAMNAARCVFV
jgi:hypothetical protein